MEQRYVREFKSNIRQKSKPHTLRYLHYCTFLVLILMLGLASRSSSQQ